MQFAEIETPETTISTPWGSDVLYLQRPNKDVVYYRTQDYGGLCCTRTWAQQNLTTVARSFAVPWRGKLWYGKEREIYIVYLERPELFEPIHKTEAKSKEFETYVQTFFPQYFDAQHKAMVESKETIPVANTLQYGDEIALLHYGYPDNLKVYKFISPYGKQQKSYCLVDEDGCVYKFSHGKLKQTVLLISRGDSILWERA